MNKQWDFIKLKSFLTAQKTVNALKNQPTDWGKNVNKLSDKGLISSILYIKLFLYILRAKMQLTQFKKWAKDLNT